LLQGILIRQNYSLSYWGNSISQNHLFFISPTDHLLKANHNLELKQIGAQNRNQTTSQRIVKLKIN